jgi:arylsulfatase A-like enzyme
MPVSLCHVISAIWYEEDLKRFAHIGDKLRSTYCAMVFRLDQNVGKILDELRKQDIERETIIVFLSDNGGQNAPGMSNGSVNAPFRGGKTTVLEGGIRVPMLLRWPAGLDAGKTVDAMVSSLDLVPTLISAAGGSIDAGDRLDGVNLLPFLTGKSDRAPHDSLMWRYTVGAARREGNWKLVSLPDRLPMLYDLSADPTEMNDVSPDQPERTRAMLKELGQWEVRSLNPVFREPAGWRVRHLGFYDSQYPLTQPQ